MKTLRLAIALFAAITLWNGTVYATATDPDCVSEEDKVPCLAAKGDPMAMYMMGRRAYEAARVAGTSRRRWRGGKR